MTTLEKVSGDLERMYAQFQIKPMSDIASILPPNRYLEMGILIAHRDLDEVLRERTWAIVSGRGPSGPMHLGHILVFELVAWFQRTFDVYAFIPLSDDEKYVFGKIDDLHDAHTWAIDNARWIASLGFNPKKTRIYISSTHPWVYRYSVFISRYLTLSTVKNALGADDSKNIGIPFYAAVQIAHILQPTIDYGLRTLVPIGLDQDVFMRLTRDVAEKLKLKKPASVYVKFLSGLKKVPMSSSIPETAIYLTDDDYTIFNKIMRAHSGGAISTVHQRIQGGNPNDCVIFEWLQAFYFRSKRESDEYAYICKTGQIICGYDCRILAYKAIKHYLDWLRRKYEKTNLEQFIWKP
ncbi:MAG: tryptophan--tRNA ligase [Crenarchaeota archaeon]|nr:tryptophan--tRNA ligase [Thermoproteota archaeon]MCR8453798.1 tryptophan--tRNA ligase [Thermoproteota archaeon]MCR8455652.1 tryptophan--tRNA ligase [Thermoproteota archaeon]MCR8462872.1 tryptophan--tRNA ligase [Thermoproteota archaeon]MCR8470982.1 tryptophan--tRNA ligase [Thermoproteota archaeon]